MNKLAEFLQSLGVHSYEGGEEDLNTTITGKLMSTPFQERKNGYIGDPHHLYQGFWYPTTVLQQLVHLQQHFKAHPTDLLLASHPKSGTTWLKALLFTITNRTRFDFLHHPLLTTNPHICISFLEVSMEPYSTDGPPLFVTHISYTLLPNSILPSDCTIVYVFRP